MAKKNKGLIFTLIRILSVAGVITALGVLNLKSCHNKFSRDWEVKTYEHAGCSYKLTLCTNRLHDPDGKGKYGSFDELQYDLNIEPQETNKEREQEFLAKQAKANPEIWFLDKEGSPVIEPLPVRLHPDDEGTQSWKATGTTIYPKELRKARDWFVQFDEKTQQR